MVETTRFDAAEYLDTAERRAAYITVALESGDADSVRDALFIVARAHGVARIARTAKLDRENLCQALGENGDLEFGPLMRILQVLGMTLSARPAKQKRTVKRSDKKRDAA
jgi:probable addiction module antidote protein